jgi:hypothetical protein
MSITRTLVATLAIAAVAAQAAQARPADIHAPVAQAAAKAQQKQDLRSPDARDAAVNARRQDLNHLRAGGLTSYTPGATAVDSTTRRSLPGPPTWPVNPRPITPAPAAKVTDGGNGVDWTTIALGIAGSLLAVGGLAAVTSRRRRTQRLGATG